MTMEINPPVMLTSNPTDVRPILFYDFNSPGEPDGTYLALPSELMTVEPGQRVLFGCCGDDLVYDGVVVALDARGLVRVAMEETP